MYSNQHPELMLRVAIRENIYFSLVQQINDNEKFFTSSDVC